jgi:uncharacterized membrane protein YkoI
MAVLRILVFMLFCSGMTGIATADILRVADNNSGRNNIVQEGQKVRVSNQQAANKVKRRYPGSKILSVKMIQNGGPPVYRIKTLSGDGVVKHVFVDGISGDLFE